MPKGHYQRTPGISAHGVPYRLAKRQGKVRTEYPNKSGSPSHTQQYTAKQKAAVEEMLANPGDTERNNVARAGYKHAEAHAPVVKESKGFQTYLDERVPDQKLAELIAAGMAAEKAPAGFEDFVPDWGNRFKFVELVAKLKGYNVTQAGPTSINVQFTNDLPRPQADIVEGEVVE